MTENVAEMFEGTIPDGNPNTMTSTVPPIDDIEDGFTERTAAAESSITEINGEVQETAAPLEAAAETLIAKEATEVGELKKSVTTVTEVLDGSK